ncbi:TPA: prepilin peptidase-dependent protein [Pluralibacter gergoviae]|uniref:Prepilin-type cleavage/methylation domain-containing protein n=1 Tax=Pluralibacter gergoviae TaxID=61647 RepID=A0A0J5L9K9_PLUGE|nr:prepilin peptidase-dependent protein [Pluralibacter gergoviae]KMK15285.1 hypothetical protein ABW06_04715 [Pluralibacter gergoviae]KMK25175.1 hypothetical protein ABW10_07570 [Pluralibacter gergoviae]MBL3694206.1 prepilin peptidase-dependent protein [Pluralibacter gergoviae]HDS1150997.1 prepilin peptidase-dependent protein [Pluralibacter gergoviae]
MKREQGYTLTEMLVAMALMMILAGVGAWSWQRWQQRERLWQVAVQVRDYLALLRSDASWHRWDRLPEVRQGTAGWCLDAREENHPPCPADTPFVLLPAWPEVALEEMTPSLGFYGLRSTAWPGHVVLRSPAGRWRVVVSVWGRIRLCEAGRGQECP